MNIFNGLIANLQKISSLSVHRRPKLLNKAALKKCNKPQSILKRQYPFDNFMTGIWNNPIGCIVKGLTPNK